MSSITSRELGTMPDGRTVTEYTLDNGRGLSLSAMNLGGIVTALRVPDRHGKSENVVLGLPTLADYLKPHPHLGSVGRHANRIAAGRFTLDGVTHQLGLNNGVNSLHGGATGFGKRYWDIVPLSAEETGSDTAIELHYTSADGEEGYPGELRLTVRYTLAAADEADAHGSGNGSGNGRGNTWRIDYSATTDKPTVLNLSHHDYFNLAGSGSVMDHRLTLAASRYCPVDDTLIPLGLADVDGTPFDFRSPTRIGERIRQGHAQLMRAHGYDHNWVLDRGHSPHAPHGPRGLALAARLEHEATGRVMEVHTSEPGVQFYSGNFLDGSLFGSAGASLRQGDGLCLETQHFPDSPNQPGFPSTVLRPGERFHSATEHRFSVRA